ncbi:acyltransferase family protein [Marinitenerispora sediminis]|uniref:acyltransferase family protein n=1 Tax=Marinitenerispora sediminis TaxID=1931232 RepID=UPI0018F135D7|nr:acyltransferase family protein [Marinitenerispora sediminis]
MPPTGPGADDRRRLYYLDNLRLLLIVLVVAHHAGQPYGPADWWYVEGGDRSALISTFAAISGAFRMSLFFLVSAYLLPHAYDRKGGARFLAERFRRFGPPILIGFFVLIPVLMYAYYLNFRDHGPIGFGAYYLDVYLGMGDEPAGWSGPIWPDRQFGHLWFLQHLLCYALLYAAWRWITARRTTPPASARPHGAAPGTLAIVLFVLAVSGATFLLRVWYPVDQWVPMLEFIQTEPADLAQYAAFFVVGLAAYRRGWLAALPTRAGYAWLGVGIVLAGAHFAGGGWFDDVYAMGGWDVRSLLWSTVETLICTALSIGLLVVFREWADRPSRLVRALAPATFTVYVLHVPVVVALQYAMTDAGTGPLLAFGVVSVTGVLLSFALAWCVRRTPVLRRLL